MDKVFAAVVRLVPRQVRLLRHPVGLAERVAALKEKLHSGTVHAVALFEHAASMHCLRT